MRLLAISPGGIGNGLAQRWSSIIVTVTYLSRQRRQSHKRTASHHHQNTPNPLHCTSTSRQSKHHIKTGLTPVPQF
jgi:predicted dinucleotide-binding enzyme